MAPVAAGDCPQGDPNGFSDPLRHRARAEGDAFIEILEVVKRGDHVYACTATQGLTIWEVSEADAAPLVAEGIAPSRKAHAKFPRCQHLSLQGGARDRVDLVAVTSRGDEIQRDPFVGLLDIRRPKRPKTLAIFTGSESFEGVAFSGEDIVVAAHGDGMLVLRRDGKTLKKAASFSDKDSDAWFPFVVGRHVIVAEGETGLRTYALRSGRLELLATLPLEGSSKHLDVQGQTAFVATSVGLATVDISDPASPKLLGSVTTPGTALAVAAGRPGTVFVADWDQIRGFDVADPARPALLLSEVVPTQGDFSRVLALDADVDGRVFAGEWQGLQLFEHEKAGPSPELELQGAPITLGRTETGKPALAEFTVSNSGSAPLTISSIETTQPGLSATPACLQLAPGESATVDVRLELSGRGPVSTDLVVRTDDPDESTVAVGVSANQPGLSVGDRVPDFDLLDLSGRRWSRAGLEGKVAVLAYFATF